jgi:anti-sigma-K factor RskA
MTDDDDLLAAELALGLLESDQAEAARARAAGDDGFAQRVSWWESQFADLARPASIPDDRLWQRIVARLPANDNFAALARWRAAAVAMMLLAAGLVTALIMRPDPAPQPQSLPVMVASLEGEGGNAALAVYTADGKLVITPKSMNVGSGDAELWVIGATQVPVSLGVINASARTTRQLDAANAAMISAGATFAITRERRGGSPTGKPGGPILASGTIMSN